jgi:uncharacterized LabA/DUF88 family protein
MTAQFARGPQPRVTSQPPNAPHAALLIDFDNVTMGIRSDLTKELKNLLNSDIIKGKVAVQRAYADWRRYPQYIVPLAENSVDLIFAPAYGSSKKNATDIRLAIDALELVFTRAEIGTFILLSGDSDFSALVLKLKEYGKYVIGVGIRESSSDLLVQNCDEYYSYSGLTGLTRAGDEAPTEKFDPWELVEIGVRQMADQKDVMRSDRLKQILLELDPNFDEKSLGFPKFNRFLQEAAIRGLLQLKKMENGQFEVAPVEPGTAPPVEQPRPEPRRGRGRARAEGQPARAQTPPPQIAAAPDEAVEEAPPSRPPAEEPVRAEAPRAPVEEAKPAASGELRDAYELLQRATSDLSRGKGGPVRDSDVKRRMLELRPGFDEGTYGFSKFSRFLRQAHDAEVINLNKVENGSYEVTAGAQAAAYRGAHQPKDDVARAAAPEATEVVRDRSENGDRERRPRGRDRGRGRDRDRDRGRDFGRDRDRERPPRAWERVDVKPVEANPAAETEPASAAQVEETPRRAPEQPPRIEREERARPAAQSAAPTPAAAPSSSAAKSSVSLGFRRGSRRGGPAPAAPPPILAGQAITQPKQAQPNKAPVAEEPPLVQPQIPAEPERTEEKRPARKRPARAESPPTLAAVEAAAPAEVAFESLRLPTVETDIVDRLAGYKGVGRKSAEALVQAFGPDAFRVLQEHPDRVRQMLGVRRADQLLRGWQQDREALSSTGDGSKRAGGRKSAPRKAARSAVSNEPREAAAPKRPSSRGPHKRRGARKAGPRSEQ